MQKAAPASNKINNAEPLIEAACASPVRSSALPCPNRWSLSAGTSAWRTASKCINDAPTYSNESIKVESRLNDSLAIQAPNLKRTKKLATETSQQVANLISLEIAGSISDDVLVLLMFLVTLPIKDTKFLSSTCHLHDGRPVFHAVETACWSKTQ
jgi:hypothetical protein